VEEKMGLTMAKTPKVNLRTVPYTQLAGPSERVEKKQPPAESLPEELPFGSPGEE
jgi:hypothetical protein